MTIIGVLDPGGMSARSARGEERSWIGEMQQTARAGTDAVEELLAASGYRALDASVS